MVDGRPRFVNNGQDVVGSINGEPAFGEGQVLTGCVGNRTSDGLSVRFSGAVQETPALPAAVQGRRSNWNIGLDDDGIPGTEVGRVILSHQPMVLRLGMADSESVSLSLNSMRSSHLGMGEETTCGFSSLAEIRLDAPHHAHDARKVFLRAREEVKDVVSRLEELTSLVLEGALVKLRARAESVSALLTNIGDSRAAYEATRVLREQFHAQAGLALAAQPNPVPGTMMRLLS